MSKVTNHKSMSILKKNNHLGMALFVFVVLVGTILWLTGNLHFGPGRITQAADVGHDAEESSQVTVWTDRFEIFLEHSFIVANTPTRFITHVSDLVTLEPRKKGPVTFVLRHGSETQLKHIEQAPARDGIYIPELTFPLPGQWSVSLVIPLKGKDHVVELPQFKVYSSHEEADHAPIPEEVAGISFLKEQQWKKPTRTEPARWRKVLGQDALAIPESAIIDEYGRAVAFVQVAGETFQKRYLELGERDNGFVKVVSGLSDGEHVTTKGADAVAEAEHEEHGHASVINLAADDIKRYGIEVGTAGPGEIDVHVRLPGQIVINTDRMAHIVPNALGVVRQVLRNVGDTVKAGEVLAWLESAELGRAKVNYLARWAEVGCCSMDLIRTQKVHESMTKLLETLKSAPSLDTLRGMSGAAMDKNHSALVSAYAEFILAKSTYLREKSLFEKTISSENEYLTAEKEFKKADAKYAAMRDSIAFEIQRNLLEARRAQQLRQIELKGAERNLYVLGLTAKDVNEIQLFARSQTSAGAQEEEECDDPNCTECALRPSQDDQSVAAVSISNNEKLAWYPLRAPFDATVIEKHITLGEKLNGDASAFTVADLSSVWIDLNVFSKDLPFVKPGQHVTIAAAPAIPKVEGRISYVGPVVGEKTRTAPARIVLDNTSGQLRPGTFVTADVSVDKAAARIAVNKSILQELNDETIVFVQTENGFETRDVILGRSNDNFVEITSGLEPGEKIVTKNSFRLKAELEKDTGGGHAGHGHAH